MKKRTVLHEVEWMSMDMYYMANRYNGQDEDTPDDLYIKEKEIKNTILKQAQTIVNLLTKDMKESKNVR